MISLSNVLLYVHNDNELGKYKIMSYEQCSGTIKKIIMSSNT